MNQAATAIKVIEEGISVGRKTNKEIYLYLSVFVLANQPMDEEGSEVVLKLPEQTGHLAVPASLRHKNEPAGSKVL